MCCSYDVTYVMKWTILRFLSDIVLFSTLKIKVS